MAKRIDQAEKKYRRDADNGDPEAQFKLGHAHMLDALKSKDSSPDYSEALILIRKAAEQGHALAFSQLGYFYLLGNGVTIDLEESKSWFRKAAEKGHVHDQFNYATLCWNGDFGNDFPGEAEHWWLKAADQGMAEAHHALGHFYEGYYSGKEPRDPVAGYMWYTLAALRDKPGHSPRAARAERDRLAENMTPDEITASEARVQEWLQNHESVMERDIVRSWREYVAEPPEPLSPEEEAKTAERIEEIKKFRDEFGEES